MSAPPPQGPYGPQQPGPYPGQPQGGPPPPPGYGQQPPGYGGPGYGQQPPQGPPPPGGPGGPPPPGGLYGGAPQGPPPPGYGQQPTGGSGSRKGLIIGGAIAGAVILIGGLVALAVSSGSGEYGTLAEDQCHTILPESTFERVSDGESVYVDGEYEEYSGTDDSHVLECEVSFGSSDNPEHAVHVMAEIHEVDSSGHREMTDDLTEGLEELEDNLEPGELGRPSGDTDLGSAASGDMIWQHTSQGEEGAVLAMPSDGEYAPDIAGAYVRDQNASFAVTAIFPQSSDFDPEDGMSDAESLAGDVISAIRSVNEAP